MYTYVPILAPYVEHAGGSLFFVVVVLGSYGLTQMLATASGGYLTEYYGWHTSFWLGEPVLQRDVAMTEEK